jgi:hypothetical protein
MAAIEADLSGAAWHKSTRSNNGGACVEVATNVPGAVAVRDSKDPHGPRLVFTPAGWQAFTTAIRASAVLP